MMRIPPYWARAFYTGPDAKGNTTTYSAHGWSFDSPEDAYNAALTRAKRVYDRMVHNERLGQYEYLDTPLREQIMDTLTIGGQDEAIITRNRYGALVLNAPRVCFVDIDTPKQFINPIGGIIAKLFKRTPATPPADPQLAHVREWAQQNPYRSFITYRTHAGYRLVFTDKLYDPASDETKQLLNQLNSDPLYRKLCEKQECFRARLTPKPWRIGCTDPSKKALNYPWMDTATQAAFEQWRQDYEKKSQPYRVCERIEENGPPTQLETIRAVIAIHDQYTCNGGQQLA